MIQTAFSTAPALAHEECGKALANPPITGLTRDGSVQGLPAQVVPENGLWLIRQPLLAPRRNKTSRKKPEIEGGFVAFPRTALYSQAFIDLPANAARAYLYFLDKLHLHYTDPLRFKARFTFSYSEGERYGFAPGTFSKVLWRLVLHGFIDPVVRGGLRGEKKKTSTFRVSRRWLRYGQADFVTVKYDKKKRQTRNPSAPVSVNVDTQTTCEPTSLALARRSAIACTYSSLPHDPSVSGEYYRVAAIN